MRVLITGGTGSIGKKVCLKFIEEGHSVVVFNRSVSRSLDLKFLDKITVENGNITNKNRLSYVFEKHKIEGVVHCAANKHVVFCENNPLEAVQDNIVGSMNVMQVALDQGVERFVFISTDKVCDPSDVYSITKRVVEKMVSSTGSKNKIHYNSVRLGNVVGSNGSVFSIWENQISQGVPIIVRKFKGDDVFRFFTTDTIAAKMIYDAFSSDYKGCVFAKEHVSLNIGLMSKIVSKGNHLIKEEEMDISEKQHAILVNENEFCKKIDDLFVISDFFEETISEEYSTKTISPLGRKESEDFLKALK